MKSPYTPPKRGNPPPRATTPREEEPFFTQSAIQRRHGWTSELIHALLGPAELTRPGIRDPNQTIRLWRRERIKLAETHPRFRGSLEMPGEILSVNAGINPQDLRALPRNHPLHDLSAARRQFITGRFTVPLRTRHQPHDLWELLSALIPGPRALDAVSGETPQSSAQRGAATHVLISALAHAYPHLWPDLKDYAEALDLLAELRLPQLSALHPTSLGPSLGRQLQLAREVWNLPDPQLN